MKQYVNSNSEYLQLIEEDGEFTLESQLYNSKERFLVNKDGMYQIQDTVYKILDNNKIAVMVDNIDLLKQIDNSSDLDKYSEMLVHCNYLPSSHKDAYIECGKYKKWWTTNGKNRTRVEIKVSWDGYNVETWYQVRPLKRSWGAWIWCSRTIDFDIKLGINYAVSTPGFEDKWYNKSYSFKNREHTSKFEHTYREWTGYNGSSQHFSSYSIYADTPSTSAISKYCD